MYKAISTFIAGCMLLSLVAVSFAKADVTEEIPKETFADAKTQEFSYDTYLAVHETTQPAEAELELPVSSCAFSEEVQLLERDVLPGLSGDDYYIWDNTQGRLDWEVNIPSDGSYQLEIVYCPVPGKTESVEIGLEIDNTVLFEEMQRLSLPRWWRAVGDPRTDAQGNMFAPEQKEVTDWFSYIAKDADGIYTDTFQFALTAGKHTISLIAGAGAFAVKKIMLSPPEKVNFQTVENGADHYQGDSIILEGESADLRSTYSLVALSELSTPDVYPASWDGGQLNYIGGSNWKNPGDVLSWKVDVPQTGYYTLYIKYRQNYLLNGETYRRLRIDNELYHEETSVIAFPYTQKFKLLTPTDENGQAIPIYLTEGEHTLSLEVTMGPMAEINRELEDLVYRLGTVYRKIVMITGDTPDADRDYNLFGQIPDLEEQFTSFITILTSLAEQTEQLSGQRGNSGAAILRNMAGTLERMIEFFYQAQQYKKDYYNNYCSVSSWLNEMKEMPLDIDRLILSSPDTVPEVENANFFTSIAFSAKRLFKTFIADYNNQDMAATETITCWVYWGRDQAKVLDYLTRASFTPKTGISVNLKIVNASLVQAILSGAGPDCALSLSRSDPVNLAMRGALHPLSDFPDYEKMTTVFMPNADLPYKYQGKSYGLPDIQRFFVMFYRRDILEGLRLSVPKTWDDFIFTLTVLQRNGMNVGLPYTSISDYDTVNAGAGALSLYPTILAQFGGQMYTDDLTATQLSSQKAIEAFTFWTDLYNQYDLPQTYNFYNRFRTGEMPLAIASYTQYALLSVAAPEISGKWDIAEVPGYVREDGTFSNTVTGGGTADVILKESAHKEAAWQYLCWWMSADTQTSYSTEIEAILGISARQPTANVEALSRLSWKGNGLSVLQSQWEKVEELPEVPGGYFTARAIDQAFWNAVHYTAAPRELIVDWGRSVDEEIIRKRAEYGLDS